MAIDIQAMTPSSKHQQMPFASYWRNLKKTLNDSVAKKKILNDAASTELVKKIIDEKDPIKD